jgi:hypothetical protein
VASWQQVPRQRPNPHLGVDNPLYLHQALDKLADVGKIAKTEMTSMETTAQDQTINGRKRRYRDRVSTVQLYIALEGLLPAAEIEIECRASYAHEFPDDEDHATDVEFARQGQAAITLAKQLIARKSANIRRKQQAIRDSEGQADA